MARSTRHTRSLIPFDTLTTAEQDRCRKINARLREIEAWACARALAVAPALRTRVEDPKDPILDFEVDLELGFQLREDDPEFDEDAVDECIMVRQIHPIGSYRISRAPDPECEIGGQYDWRMDTDPPPREGDTPHCLSFQELRMIGRLSWRDVARIGFLFVDLTIREQRSCGIE